MDEKKKRFLLKADIYRILSALFSYPERISEAVEIAREIKNEVKENFPEIYDPILKIAGGNFSEDELLSEYSVFMKGLIPISEGSYTLQSAGDVAGFYRAFGLKPKEGENPDSLPYELEFLSFLCLKIAMAPDPEKEEIALSAYKKFIDDHISRWVWKFCKKVKESDLGEFYKNAVGMLEVWLNTEKRENTIHNGKEGSSKDGKENNSCC